MKVVFMGTPDFAKESLEALHNAKYDILAVVTNIDKPQGRGMKLVASPVKQFAQEHGLKVMQPEKVRKNTEFLDEIRKLKPDIICVVAYGKILPQELLDIPKLGCINVHGSLLPKYRGAAPIQWAVINGEKVTGITTMYMDAGMDTGDMLLKEEVTIGEDETTGELWDRLSKIGANLLIETLKKIENGTIKRVKQGDDFSLAPMLNKEMANIDWEEKNAREIKNLVRGLNPIMGAYSFLNGKKIKFWKVDAMTNENFFDKFNEFKEYDYKFKNIAPGTILYVNDKAGFYVKAKEGILSLLEVQGENAKRMPFGDFLRGNHINAADMFEKE
ncbi:MAG: methionyl-tRNA formyltransferase [Clostridia bacterium]|nr:methionyl-tRNA formyltransferase [Clostridia bacterium]